MANKQIKVFNNISNKCKLILLEVLCNLNQNGYHYEIKKNLTRMGKNIYLFICGMNTFSYGLYEDECGDYSNARNRTTKKMLYFFFIIPGYMFKGPYILFQEIAPIHCSSAYNSQEIESASMLTNKSKLPSCNPIKYI